MKSHLPQVHFLPGQRFECTSCGKCCASGWKVPVNKQAREIIEESQVYAEVKKEGYLPLQIADDGKASIGRQANGACVFLAEDDLCNLHREVGLEKKPVVCRTYPRVVTNTPDGYFVSLSFACPAVLDNQGVLLSEEKLEIQELLQAFDSEVPQNVPLKERVRIAADQELPWKDYRALEERLLESFDARRPALSTLAMAEQLMRACSSRELSLLLQNGFDQDEQTSPLASQLLDVFTLHCLAILELETAPDERVGLMERLVGGESVVSTRHGFPLHLSDILSEARAEDVESIRFYFQNIVFGKRLKNSSVTSGLITVAVGMSLLLFYLEVFRRGLSDQEARERAFEIVEADVVTHSSGLDVLLDEFGKALAGE